MPVSITNFVILFIAFINLQIYYNLIANNLYFCINFKLFNIY